MFAYGLSPCEMNQSYLTLIVGGSLLYSVPTKSALRTTVLRSTVLRTTVLRTTVQLNKNTTFKLNMIKVLK